MRRSRFLAVLLLGVVLIACGQDGAPVANPQVTVAATATAVPTPTLAAFGSPTPQPLTLTATASPRPPTATTRPWFAPPVLPLALSTPSVVAVAPTPEPPASPLAPSPAPSAEPPIFDGCATGSRRTPLFADAAGAVFPPVAALPTRAPAATTPLIEVTPTPLPPRPVPALAGELEPAVVALVADYEDAGLDIAGVVVTAGCAEPLAAFNADVVLPTASLYKLFVLWQVQRAITAGNLDDDTALVLTAENDDSADDGYQLGEYGQAITVAEARALMIERSNNTAAWMLAQAVGWGAIDEMLVANGFAHSRAAEGVTTPREIARFFDGLLDQTLDPELGAADYALMLELLKGQEVNYLLSTGLPSGTVFAHKTGNLPGVINDAGIVYLPDGRTLTIAALTTGDEGAGQALLHDLAALIWRYCVGR